MQVFNPRTYRDGWNSLFSRWQWNRDKFFTRLISAAFYGRNDPTIEIDCEDSLTAYMDCPHLRAVIDKKAEMFASGEWKCVSIEDEDTEFKDDPGLVLLNKPNPFQSREDFLFQASFYKSLFSNNFIYKVQGSQLVLPKVLWHLPSDEMSIKFKNMLTFFDQSEFKDIVDKFILCAETSNEKQYDPKYVIYKAENFSFKEGKGISKIQSLKLPVNNLVASLKTRNIMTVNFGVKGFLSSEGKDVIGPLNLKQSSRELIEKEFEKDSDLYSDRPKIKIVNVPTKFNQMSAPAREMMLLEGEEADFKTICAALGMKKDLFPFVTGATFENQIQAEVSTYQSTIMQDADSFAGVMTEALKPAAGRKYILSYDWLPIMKEDEKKEAETQLVETNRLSKLYADNIISAEAYAEMADVDMTGTGEVPKGLTLPSDNLGKIPLAIQQLALARERANTAGDVAMSEQLGTAIDTLTATLMASVKE